MADFTFIRTWQGWAYLALVIDVHTRMIVGWQLAPHMRQALVDDALAMAIELRPDRDPDLIHHGDNGSQPRFKGSSQHRLVERRVGDR